MSRDTFALKNTLIAVIVLFVLGYAAFNSRFIVQGPEITLENVDPETSSVISSEKTFFLKGKVEHSSFISINGRPIFIDEQGFFKEKLLLSNGVSIIDIYAKDKFGKEIRKKIDVLYQGESPIADFNSIALAASTTTEESIEEESGTETFLLLAEASTELSSTTSTSTPLED